MLWLCLIPAVVSCVISLVMCRMLIGVSGRLGIYDQPGREAHKKHDRPVANTAGIGIFWAIVIPLAAAIAAAWVAPASLWTGWLAPVAAHVPGIKAQTPMALGLLGAMAAMHGMGLIDDRRSLGPFVKLAVQVLVATMLVIFFDTRIFELLDQFGPPGVVASAIISVLWIVVITNAMNMLDNMDGLSGGVGAIIAGLYLAATLIGGQWFVAALCAMLLGALVGFLFFNFPPARIFMGDGGSLVIGLLLGVVSIRTTYSVLPAEGVAGSAAGEPGPWFGVLMPLMVMAIPLYDFVSVTLVRLAKGQSPFKGDHNHFSHRLVRRGLSRRAAVIVIWLCTLATGLCGVMLSTLAGWQAIIVAMQTVAVLVILAMLERGSA